MRAIDDNVVSRLIGMPEAQRAAVLLDLREGNEAVVKGRGMAGELLMKLAERLS